MHTLYTLGYQGRSLEEFVAIIRGVSASAVVDVRAQPEDDNDIFNEPELRTALERCGVQYHWAGRQLAGPRTQRANSRHRALNTELRGYADYMETDGFRRAAAQLMQMAAKARIVIFAELRDAEQDYRGLLSDYLSLQGISVVHLLDPGSQQDHRLHVAARRESSELVYDRQPVASKE